MHAACASSVAALRLPALVLPVNSHLAGQRQPAIECSSRVTLSPPTPPASIADFYEASLSVELWPAPATGRAPASLSVHTNYSDKNTHACSPTPPGARDPEKDII